MISIKQETTECKEFFIDKFSLNSFLLFNSSVLIKEFFSVFLQNAQIRLTSISNFRILLFVFFIK